MFLKTLRVVAANKDVRRVDFKLGLNLIVDETPSSADPRDEAELPLADAPSKDSGNNVGKTTVLRCVDFCLGGKIEPLYTDPEFKTANAAVLNFLTQKEPEFILELFDAAGTVITISRKASDLGGSVDGEELSKKEFEERLRWILFRSQSTHPTLRELIPKFVRVETTAKNNILRWLPYGKNENYEAIWLTLFGNMNPRLLKVRRDLKKALARLSKQVTALKQVSSSPRQELPVVLRMLADANKRLTDLSLEGAYDGPLVRLASLRAEIAQQNQLIAEKEAALANVSRTLEFFSVELPPIDAGELRELYEDAGTYVPELQASYESLVKFHATLLRNKTKFVRKSQEELERDLDRTRRNVAVHLTEEARLLREFADPGVFADVRQLSDEIARLSQRRGELESLGKAVAEVRAEADVKKAELADTEKLVAEATQQIEANLELMNLYLTEYSERLYSETLLITMDVPGPDDKRQNVGFRLLNLEGNEGSGKKKGQIAAFDLAYLRYRQQREAKTIRFTLQDEVEVIDGKQLRALFEIAESIQGQFVIPVLNDRLAAVAFPGAEKCVVLRLSQAERFFRLG